MSELHPLKKFRAEHELTQEQLGEWFGVDGMTVSRWERGECLPQSRFWAPISDKTGVSMDSILAFRNRQLQGAAA